MGLRARRTGSEWIEAFLQEKIRLAFDSAWLTFAIGQAGVLAKHDPEAARKVVAALEDDVAEMLAAAEALAKATDDLLACEGEVRPGAGGIHTRATLTGGVGADARASPERDNQRSGCRKPGCDH